MLNKEIFFASLGELFNPVTMPQYRGMTAIIDYWNSIGEHDGRKLAYILATVYHECDKKMQPISEYRLGKGKAYGVPDAITGKTYYGRGFVQLTWKDNYERVGNIIGVDLANNPELALNTEHSAKILVEGMLGGWFTGRRLNDYFKENEIADPLNARKIINRTDKAELIAGYYNKFLTAIFKAT
jgi:putative chitinase